MFDFFLWSSDYYILLIPIIKYWLKERWQKQWKEERKLPLLKEGEMWCKGRKRKVETVTSRLIFGNTGLISWLHKIGKHVTGRCDYCSQEETVEHVLAYCLRGKANDSKPKGHKSKP